MALLNKSYMSDDNNDTGGWRVVPAGSYVVAMTKSELKKTKDGQGRYLQCNFKVQEGDEKGAVIVERFNLVNKNKTAEEIAQAKFNQLCAAADLRDVEDSDELLDIPVVAIVGVDPGDEEWPPSNVIKSFQSVESEAGDSDKEEPKKDKKNKKEKKGKKGKKKPWE